MEADSAARTVMSPVPVVTTDVSPLAINASTARRIGIKLAPGSMFSNSARFEHCIRLSCGGTEPFWSVQTVESGLVLTQPGMEERKLTLRKVMDRGIEGEPMRGMIAGDDKGRLTAVMQPQQCSDGMSDRAYALAVTVIMDGQDSPSQMLTGCCSIAP